MASSTSTGASAGRGSRHPRGARIEGRDPQQHLLVIAARKDPRDSDDDVYTKAIDAQVDAIRHWAENAGFRSTMDTEPVPGALGVRLRDLDRLDDDDALLIYVSGHGERGSANGAHRLLVHDGADGAAEDDLVPQIELAVTRGAHHVVVLVDSCYAAALESDLLGRLRNADADKVAHHNLVLFAGEWDDEPRYQSFVSLVMRALGRTPSVDADVPSVDAEDPWLAPNDVQHLRPGRFEEALISIVREESGRFIQPRAMYAPHTDGFKFSACRALPNPRFRPYVSAPSQQVALPRDELERQGSFWLEKASGRPRGDQGWYFTGRARLIRAIIDFLERAGDVGDPPASAPLLIVTGVKGSGKSALLGRIVTFADPVFRNHDDYRRLVKATPRDLVPREGAIDLTIDARGKTTAAVVGLLAQGLTAVANSAANDARPAGGRANGRAAAQAKAWSAVVADAATAAATALGRPAVCVIDGIDEAEHVREVVTIIRDLVTPAGEESGVVRLIVSVRSTADSDLLERLRGLCRHELVATDDAEVTGEIAEYVAELLLTLSGSPYHGRRSEAIAAGRKVAARVDRSFLTARFAAMGLWTAAVPQPLGDRAWRAELSQAIVNQLRRELDRVAQQGPFGPEALLAVLRATAFARGAGLPWGRVWPALTHAILGDGPPDVDADALIARVLGSDLGQFLMTVAEDDERVFRPLHAEVTRVLVEEPHTLLGGSTPARAAAGLPTGTALAAPEPAPDAQPDAGPTGVGGRRRRGGIAPARRAMEAAIARALAGLTEPFPPAYARRHLLAHADHGSVLTDAVIPRGFLRWDTAHELRARFQLPLPTGPETRWLAAWAAMEPDLWRIAPADIGPTHSFHALDFRPTGAEEGIGWRRWNSVRNTLLRHADVEAVAFGTVEGRTVLATGAGDGMVGLWDPVTGRPLCERLDAMAKSAGAVAFGQVEGRTLLATGGDDGKVRLWDPITGRRVGTDLPGHRGAVLAVTFGEVDGQTVLATGGKDGVVRLWDPATGTARGAPLVRQDGSVRTVALGLGPDRRTRFGRRAPGRTFLAAGGKDGVVRLWDPAGGRLLHDPLTRLSADVRSAAFGQVDTRPGGSARHGRRTVLAIGDGAGRVQLWDPATGSPLTDPVPGHKNNVRALAFGHVNGRTVLATGGGGGQVRLRDPLTAQPIGEPLTGHTGAVRALAFGRVDGRDVLATGGREGAVRLWDLAAGGSGPDPGPDRGHPPETVAFAEVDGALVLVTGGRASAVRLWDPATGQPRNDPLTGRTSRATTLAAGQIDGRPVLATGDNGGKVRWWDMSTGLALCEPRNGHKGTVNAIALGQVRGHMMPATGGEDGIVRLWAPEPGGRPDGQPLTGHKGPVRALAFGLVREHVVLATGGNDGTVRLWDPTTRRPLGEPLTGHEDWVNAITFAQVNDRTVLISGSDDHTVRMWDPTTRREPVGPLLGHTDWVNALALGRLDGRTVLATGGGDGTVRIWDPSDGTPLHTLHTFTAIEDLAFAPDGSLALAAAAGIALLRPQLWRGVTPPADLPPPEDPP